MTPTTQPDDEFNSPLGDDGQELAMVAQNIVYDQQGVQLIEQALQNTKSKDAIPFAVALVAVTLLSQMVDRLRGMPEEQVWGKMGVVYAVLVSIFDVAKELGYQTPYSNLKVAYEIVEEQLESQLSPDGMDEDVPMDQDLAQPEMPVTQPMMGGVMPGGMQ